MSCVQRWHLTESYWACTFTPVVPAEGREPQGIVAVNWHLAERSAVTAHTARQDVGWCDTRHRAPAAMSWKGVTLRTDRPDTVGDATKGLRCRESWGPRHPYSLSIYKHCDLCHVISSKRRDEKMDGFSNRESAVLISSQCLNSQQHPVITCAP